MTFRQRTSTTADSTPQDTFSTGRNDPGLDRPRQTMAATQRHNVEQVGSSEARKRHHSSSRRVDPTDPSAAHISSRHKSSSKDHSSAVPQGTSYYSAPQTQNYAIPIATQVGVSPLQLGSQETYTDVYGLRAYLKKRAGKHSPRSSNEKVSSPEDVKVSRSSQQSRAGYATTTTIPPQTSSIHQSYWVPPTPTTRDPSSAARHHKEREKDGRKRRAEARRTRSKETEVERARRKERDREKDRSGKERDKHRDKEKSKDREGRRRADSDALDGRPVPVTQSQHSDVPKSQYPDGRMAPATIPPTDPPTPYVSQRPATNRPDVNRPTADPPSAPRVMPLYLPERDKLSSKHHRSHRDRIAAQQNAQDSGVSSSEQEGRERKRPATEKRYLLKEQKGDNNPSGPSGSENERATTRERRKISRTPGESSGLARATVVYESNSAAVAAQLGYSSNQEVGNTWYQQASIDNPFAICLPIRPSDTVQFPPSAAPVQSSVPSVSIRAGQGPADPQSPKVFPAAAPSASYSYDAMGRVQLASYHTQQPSVQVSYSATITTANAAVHQSSSASDATTGIHLPPSTMQQSSLLSDLRQAPSHSSHTAVAPSTATYPVAQTNQTADAAIRSLVSMSIPQNTNVSMPSAAVPLTNQAAGRSTGMSTTPYLQNGQSSGQYQSGDPRAQTYKSAVHGVQTSVEQPYVPQPATSYSYSPARHASLDTYRSPAPGSMPLSGAEATSTATQNKDTALPSSQKMPIEPVVDRPRTSAPSTGQSVPSTSQHTSSRFPVVEDSPLASTSKAHTGVHGISDYSRRTDPAAPASHPHGSPGGVRYPGQPNAPASPSTPYPLGNLSSQYVQSLAGPSHTAIPSNQVYNEQSYDPRSPKPPVAPSMQALDSVPSYPSRSHTYPVNSREMPAHTSTTNVMYQSPARYSQSLNPPLAAAHMPGQFVSAIQNTSTHSPRNASADSLRTPGMYHAVPAASNTPKHSPESRLHSQHRNGSNDTITQTPPSKPSPTANSGQQPLPHRSGVANAQPHVTSRPDTVTRPSNSGYPDITRYRSPPPAYSVPSSYVLTAQHSQSYSTQTPIASSRPAMSSAGATPSYEYQYNPRVPGTSSSQVVSSSQPPGRAQASEYAMHAPDGIQVVPASATTSTPSGHRVPSRSAPSPVPTPARQHYDVSAPSSKIPSTLPSSLPQPNRTQTYPIPSGRSAPSFPASHSRTVSDPQHAQGGRTNASVYPSTQATSRTHLPSRTAPSPAPPADLLLTPSSLTPSMLPQVSAPGSTTVHSSVDRSSKETEKETKKRSGFFGLFRSRSSPPKQDARGPPMTTRPADQPRQRNLSHPSGTPVVTAAPPPSAAAPQSATPRTASQSVPVVAPPAHTRGAAPIAAPTPVPAVSGRKSPGGKMFTPFRLLSKRHRTVSAASVEAVDGTIANTIRTGADSTRSSTAGRPSPPLRDPMVAAQEWRNKEEAEFRDRGTWRRRRPGVTFDVAEDRLEEARPALQKMQRTGRQQA
ncbi:hypothetical protein A0H81_04190 [Grifola frondosa]|uniref:Uncharacterized protein n=1 Tax=Grifola frondosa TaxID=5627 RepID=A0A1C7MER0_GRIFR|nr:hypothetical protein A0H81_04190 [Grifola frondosa]